MPADPRKTVLCRYHYDPLDRLTDCSPAAEAGIQRFYCKSRLATEIQGAVQRSVFQHDDQLLAQLRRENLKADATLLATDQQRTVLTAHDATQTHPLAYTPYGHRPAENGLLSLLGFNGERPDPVTGHYLLGNGYRAFNPVLMRFNSPDSWSPFGEGGLNAYAYCAGDPRNAVDPTGHIKFFSSVKDAVRSYKRNLAEMLPPSPETIALPERANGRPYSADLKALADTIIQNERALPDKLKTYAVSSAPKTYEEALLAYKEAQRGYGFSKNPSLHAIHYVKYPENGVLTHSPTLLDVLPFDAEIAFRTLEFENQQLNHQPRNRELIDMAIIRRAIYINNHTETNLMTIRQQN
ncbi:RHS repeat-associated core domain-containing protein [Pseudomonas sp. SMN5]|uniref:RHS repeat-associated core domain-containing protein n=1 Tax=Pseudomonas sp. SMN5 TaxID=3390198 RepID=UPI003F85884F